MTTRERFGRQLRTLRKQAFLRALTRISGDTLLIALSWITMTVVLRKASMFSGEGYAIYFLFCLLSLGFALLIEVRAPNRFFKELMDVDQRFQLREMLSTAYECLRRGRQTIFLERLFEEASGFLSRVQVRELLPVQLLGRHAGIPLLAMVLILVLFLDFLPARTQRPMAYNPALHRLAVEMERISQGKEKKKSPDGTEKKGEDEISKRMKELERQLQNRSLTSKKALQFLRELLAEAQNEQGKLARQLAQELSLQNIEGVPSVEPELQKGIPLKSLNQLEDLLREFFGGEVPDSLTEKLVALKSLSETQKGLGLAMDEIQADSRDSPQVAKSEKESQERSPEPQGDGLSNRPASSDGEGPQGEDEEDPDAMNSSMAGRARDSQEPANPRDMESTGNLPMKDRGFEGPGKTYSLLVRSLPMVEKGKMKPEDLIRSYRREIEEVLTNDEIPLNDREFIRDYFLSIGAERESGENE